MQAPFSRWITCPRPEPAARVRLWCLPFAGGGAAIWRPWALALAGFAELFAIRAPGREDRFAEPPMARWSELVAAIVENMAPYLNENYVLCGVSLGGLLAFEIARTLRARGLPMPRALVICATRAPHHPADRPLLHLLPDRELVAEVERRYGAIPPEVRDDPEVLALVLPVLRADLAVYETYAYAEAAPLDLPILALAGRHDRTVSPAQVRDWHAYTTAEAETDVLPGGHFFATENAGPTASRVRSFLGRLPELRVRAAHAMGNAGRFHAGCVTVPR